MPVIHGINESQSTSSLVVGMSGLAVPENNRITAARVDVASDNANDTVAGTGARKVILSGLDDSGVLVSESISMNGTTKVTTLNTYSLIKGVTVQEIGSAGQQGTITVTDSSTTISKINANYGRVIDAVDYFDHTIVLNKLCFSAENDSTNKNFQVDICLMVPGSKRVIVLQSYIVDNNRPTYTFSLGDVEVSGLIFVRAKGLNSGTIRAAATLIYSNKPSKYTPNA